MEIDGINVKNMTNDEINSFIKQLYQSKSQDLGGGARSKVNIRTLSSSDVAFDKNGKYYEWLKNTLENNLDLSGYDIAYMILFQKNDINFVQSLIWWSNAKTYEDRIDFGFKYNRLFPKSETTGTGRSNSNIFIMNYDE